jgi:endo-1,4-beta-xylanase
MGSAEHDRQILYNNKSPSAGAGKMKTLKACFLFISLIFITTCGMGQPVAKSEKGLKDYYKAHFPIGVAVSPRDLQGPEAELILREFNGITAENAMKIGPIHPEENRFNWEPADQIVNFAQTNGLRMRGHTLVWHNQTPDWLFQDGQGNLVTKEVLLKRLEDHIKAVVSRYKGKIYAWDVVNEVIDDNPAIFYRDSKWYTICGEEFISKAFEFAHAADPDALLFYNDYNTENPAKREKIYKLVKELLDKKIPVHGIGLQGHWSIYEPTEYELRESLRKFSSLGLALQITELDVSVYPSEHSRREARPGETGILTEEMVKKQSEQYNMFFRVFREYKNVITGITFWNVSDKRTWLDSFPVRGRKNYPLLFDQELKPKKAYRDVVNFSDENQ